MKIGDKVMTPDGKWGSVLDVNSLTLSDINDTYRIDYDEIGKCSGSLYREHMIFEKEID